jgi:DNA-binding NtrC family response regulator
MPTRLKILMLEDDLQDLFFARRAFDKAGLSFELHNACTRDGFAAELGSFRPDVIISDSKFGSVESPEAFREAQQLAPKTPFIVFTGHGNRQNPPDWIPDGATYFPKSELATMVAHVRKLFPDSESKPQS